MPKRIIFVTGTNTGVGKTYLSVGLLRHYAKQGYQTVGLKPIASGCDDRGKSDDVLALMKASTVELPYSMVNPFALLLPVAPHLAAQEMGVHLNVADLNQQVLPVLSMAVDICIVEGAGGWLVPLNAKETYADWVLSCQMDVLLVVNMTLGCLNHALLTVESILRRQGRLIGWVANCQYPVMDKLNENIDTLIQMLPAPYIGTVFPDQDASLVFQAFNVDV
ncbi:MAG: dethiobiotin synthase [Gammaproteobacteria bacterium]|nr:dethiobiotin synthase [Gammaproteobacteria bacterium]